MKPLLIIAVVLTSLLPPAWGKEPEKWWAEEKGIAGGILVKGSTSPDGKYALYEFHHEEGGQATTITGIGLAPVGRSTLLFDIDSRTEWMTDKKVTSFLSVVWSPDSTLVATHDSGAKHSKTCIYRLHDGAASSLDLPDLLAIACQKLGLPKSSVSASGQIPVRWAKDHALDVAVRLTTAAHKLTTHILVQVAGDGAVTTQ